MAISQWIYICGSFSEQVVNSAEDGCYEKLLLSEKQTHKALSNMGNLILPEQANAIIIYR